MYDPPTYDDDVAKRAYVEGYECASMNGLILYCPYEESGHERDTTTEDELCYQWRKGFMDYSAKEEVTGA